MLERAVQELAHLIKCVNRIGGAQTVRRVGRGCRKELWEICPDGGIGWAVQEEVGLVLGALPTQLAGAVALVTPMDVAVEKPAGQLVVASAEALRRPPQVADQAACFEANLRVLCL